MTAPVRAAAAEAADAVEVEAEAEVVAEEVAEAAEVAEVEAAAAVEAEAAEAEVLPSQGHLFAAALPLSVRPPRSEQHPPIRLCLLPWPVEWPALLWARWNQPGLCPRFRLPGHPVWPLYQ